MQLSVNCRWIWIIPCWMNHIVKFLSYTSIPTYCITYDNSPSRSRTERLNHDIIRKFPALGFFSIYFQYLYFWPVLFRDDLIQRFLPFVIICFCNLMEIRIWSQSYIPFLIYWDLQGLEVPGVSRMWMTNLFLLIIYSARTRGG